MDESRHAPLILATHEAAVRKQRRAKVAQEIAGEQKTALETESTLDRELREADETMMRKLKQHAIDTGLQPELPAFEAAPRPSTPHDPSPGHHLSAVSVHDSLRLQRSLEAARKHMIAPVPQAPPSTYLKPTDVHVRDLEKQSIDRQRREFDRVKAELQAAHTKRVSAKTRVELRVPQGDISPLRDLGSAALRPGIPTVTPTRPGGSMPV